MRAIWELCFSSGGQAFGLSICCHCLRISRPMSLDSGNLCPTGPATFTEVLATPLCPVDKGMGGSSCPPQMPLSSHPSLSPSPSFTGRQHWSTLSSDYTTFYNLYLLKQFNSNQSVHWTLAAIVEPHTCQACAKHMTPIVWANPPCAFEVGIITYRWANESCAIQYVQGTVEKEKKRFNTWLIALKDT